MMEVGPWRMDGRDKLRYVDGGWEEYTHMVYGTPRQIVSHSLMLSQWTNRQELACRMPVQITSFMKWTRYAFD